jgi:TonB family protein
LATQEDNFSVQLPVPPGIRGRGAATLGPGGERISEERVASAYHNGVVYVIWMYQAPDPQRLFSKYPDIFHLSEATESSVQVGGIKGKQYLKKEEGYVRLSRLFPTKKHLYVLEAAARDEAHPDIRRFLSSLTLGESGTSGAKSTPAAESSDLADGHPLTVVPSGTKPLSDKDVTRRAVIIYKPAPPYTSLAKNSNVTGTIKLRVVLTPSGEVTEIKVLRGLTGLTEGAKEAAKFIKFLPAEKDGQLVPQYEEVEYNFVLLYGR